VLTGLDTTGFDGENHGRFHHPHVSHGVHDRWSQFLEQRGFTVAADLGAQRASATTLDTDIAATRCVDLNHFTALTLIGPDARSFLQGYLTCDLDALTETHALFGAYCNIKGRVVADAIVVLVDGHPTLLLHASLREPVVTSLKKYLAFARSRFATVDAAPILLGIVNPATSSSLPTQAWAVAPFGGGVAVAVPGAVPRAMLVLPHAEAVGVWSDCELRKQTGDASGWDLLDVRAGIAHVYAQTTETFLPQMLDYDRQGAVSFTKGCYLGQEIVARTQHLGRPKRHLHHLTWSGTAMPSVGAALLRSDQSRAGTLVGAALLEAGHGEALAVLNDDVIGPLQSPGITYTVG
jgi:folate-binding protein YgfZ